MKRKGFTYKEQPGVLLLNNFIKCFWVFNNPGAQLPVFTVLPDGCFDLIVILEKKKIKEISLTGIWTKPIDVTITPYTTILGVRFKLASVEYVFEESISQLLNNEKLLPPGFWGITEKTTKDVSHFSKVINKKVDSIILSQQTDNRKMELFHSLYKANGNIRIGQISKSVFWSSRQINRYFNNYFGLSLKSYCEILRCHAAYTDIKLGQLFPLDQYYDQPHFIREVKKITGAKPKDLYRNKNDRFIQFCDFPEL